MDGLLAEIKDCRNCFKRCPSFGLLSEAEIDVLDNGRTEVLFKRGEIIYKQGTPLTHMVIIHTGFGKIYLESSKGRNLILCYTKAFDLNGGVGVFIDKKHHSSLMAVTNCEACFIDINSFYSVMRSNESFRESYLKDVSHRVLHTYHQFAVLTQKNMEGRMAESIVYLRDKVFDSDTIHNVSNKDLAELTAMTKESAIRVLKGFKEDGLIQTVDHTFIILDKKGLEKVALYG